MGDLKELRDLWAYDEAEWKPIRDEGATDMRYAAGDPWDPTDRRTRELAQRPCISADELSQYTNQTINEFKANKRAVKFTPVGNGANDKTAQFYADKMREIEYRSRAQMAYTIAAENMVNRSFGFVRVNTRYAHSRATAQDLWIDPVPNPNMITPDATALMPDLSDMGHCWVREFWTWEDYRAQPKWADKRTVDRYTSDLGKDSAGWMTERGPFIGEFWKITTKKRKLLILKIEGDSEPIGIFEDELGDQPLPPGVSVATERDEDDPKVIQQITNGLDILEENDWPGKYIPIIGCLGKILYVSESGAQKRKILSQIRLGREPQMAHAFLWSCELETTGMMTKFPYFAYEGQLSQDSLNKIAQSNHEPVAVITVKATVDGTPLGTVLPFPQRNPWTLELQQLEILKESARRAIQSAVAGSPLPTSAQRRNEKSGVALKHIEESGQKGSFHFTDHYLDMLTQVGIVCEDLMDKIYDSTRDVGIRKDDDTAETVRVNDPNNPESISTKGDHLVTVSTGPSFDSEREAANDFAGQLIDSPIVQMLGPQKGAELIAKAIKLKNLGPIGDQMVEIIAPEQPKEGEEPTPEQLKQALGQAKSQMQEMGQMLQQAQQEIQTDAAKQRATVEKAKIDAAASERKAQIDYDLALKLQEMKNAATIAVAHIGAASKGLALDAHAAEEAQALQHEGAMTAAGQAHQREMAQIGHEQAIEQGAMGHQQALEQSEQAAALAPEPAGA
jgi:hypothetical protein